MSQESGQGAFFRQSSWMILATVSGGVFMAGVQVLAANAMKREEYVVFFALLRVFLLLSIPALGLQTVFAQQAAAAHGEPEEYMLSQITRWVLRNTFFVWLFLTLVLLAVSSRLLVVLKITHPVALWITLALGLTSLWLPVLKGLLQGRLNFAGLGSTLVLDGLGRFLAVAVMVIGLGGQAASGMGGALLGQCASLILAAWLTRRVWLGPGLPFKGRPWLRRLVPLTFGPASVLVLSTADILFVQSVFPQERTNSYMAAALIGFALAQFTTPLAAVMFPKIVRSKARSKPTDALKLTLCATLLLGGLAALACTLVPSWPLRILYFRNPDMWSAAPLVPWFAWGMLMVTAANVLISNLLAHERFQVVPWLMIIAAAYVATLWWIRPVLVARPPFDAFRLILQILSGYGLLLLAVAAGFTRWQRPFKKASPNS